VVSLSKHLEFGACDLDKISISITVQMFKVKPIRYRHWAIRIDLTIYTIPRKPQRIFF
jgi:hypothetical protein